MEIGKTQVKDVKFYQLSEEGVTKVDDCNLKNNTPSILHESCANDEGFSKILTENVHRADDDVFQIIDARNQSIPMNPAYDYPGKKFYINYV